MWKTVEGKLYKKFTFKDFKEAFAFLNQVALVAEELDHHPTIHNTYNNVELWLSTHSAGDVVTEKDRNFVERLDAVLNTTKKIHKATLPPEIKMYADGGSRGNPGPSASGYVIMDMDNQIILKSGVYVGITTNNQAEYRSLQFGLEEAHKLGASEVDVYMDSLLVINQMKGIFKVKNGELIPLQKEIQEFAKRFKKISYTHVPRELNKLADAEVNETLDAEAAK